MDNNRARTVLNLFLEKVIAHGIPRRVRGDHGTENLEVAAWMEEQFGVERGSYIWGRSDRSHICIHSVPHLYLTADLYVVEVSIIFELKDCGVT